MKILTNARVLTLDPAQPVVTALVVTDRPFGHGTILAAGDARRLEAEFGEIAAQEDLGGHVILPGLTDSHIHLRHYAGALQAVDLFGIGREAGLKKLTERAASLPPNEWVVAYGWSQDLWPASLSDLDAVLPHHPAVLTGVSLHVLWANSAAIRAAGIDPHIPDPPDGIIERGPDGQFTGFFYEEAMRLFNQVLLPPSGENTLKAFEQAQHSLWSMGITGVHDFDRIPCFITLQTLRQQGRLKLRVVKNLPVESLDELVASGLRTGLGDDLLRIGSIKAFADGALGARTAAMLEPYLDNPANRGMLRLDAEGLLEIGQQAAANGFGLTIHAIGDAANHEILNGFEQLRKLESQNAWPHYRHRIEHVQLLHPADLNRLAELDLIASMQPIHCTSDIEMADSGWGDRSRYAYAWQTLLDRGTRLTFGSDAPVDSPNPFFGLHAAITRQKAGGAPGPEGWYPQERISLYEALAAYTSGPAYTSSREARLGRLAAGYLADLIVLDEDPFDLPPADLRELRPVSTMIGGEWVYRRNP